MTITFTVPGLPVAKGRARSFTRSVGGKTFTGHYTPEKTRRAEESLAARSMQWRPEQPLTGALSLAVLFVFPVPKSWPKKRREAALTGRYQHLTTPDASNLLKLLEDSLNGIFWIDDKQICSASITKCYGKFPYTRVSVFQLTHEEK